MDRDDTLRQLLSDAYPPAGGEDAAWRSLQTRFDTARRLRRLRAVLAFTTAIVLVAGGVFAATRLLTGPPPSQVADSGLPPLAVGEAGSLTWRQQPMGRGTTPSLVHGPAGWLAMAPDPTDGWAQPSVLRSVYGASWSKLSGVRLEKAVTVDGVTGDLDGYLAYGQYAAPGYTDPTVTRRALYTPPAVWRSVDGVTWTLTRLPLPSSDEALSPYVAYRMRYAAIAGRIGVAFASEFDEATPLNPSGPLPARIVMWRTTGGGRWELVPDTPLLQQIPTQGSPGAITAGPGGITVAIPDTNGQTDIWVTADADTWRHTATIDGTVADLAATTGGYLTGTLEGGVSFSPDATTWTPITTGAESPTVGAGPGGFIYTLASPRPTTTTTPPADTAVVTTPTEPVASWTVTAFWSPDGQTWRQIAASGDLPAFGDISGAGIDLTAALIAGDLLHADGSAQGVVYTGTTP